MWIEITVKAQVPTSQIVTPLAGVWIEIASGAHGKVTLDVTPLAGVWIEIILGTPPIFLLGVTPLAGVWIEIHGQWTGCVSERSLPLRECGLKLRTLSRMFSRHAVTPLAGVWIEISRYNSPTISAVVTPLAGVWIEIYKVFLRYSYRPASLPLRECGLKFFNASKPP